MQWWCVAQTRAWDWTWQAYPGVWLFLIAVAGLYVSGLRLIPSDSPATPAELRRARRYFLVGLGLLWLSLDWPIGTLGTSYMVSVHMIQFLVIGMIAPALLLLGTPTAIFEQLPRWPRLYRAISGVTQPVVAFFVFNVGMTITHWPDVSDTLMASQLGSFVLDMTWLTCGLILWWPLISPVPDRSGFPPIMRVLYLAVNAVLIRPPFLMMIFSRYPIYATYELAPPIPGVDPLGDQQMAGGFMKVGSAWILIFGLVIVFFGWVRDSKEAEALEAAANAGRV